MIGEKVFFFNNMKDISNVADRFVGAVILAKWNKLMPFLELETLTIVRLRRRIYTRTPQI
ncbi:MAG: hypothetical protein OSA97_06965 [Nevskia sp.]|nr:hypothetical protein [Nevskia sp.]